MRRNRSPLTLQALAFLHWFIGGAGTSWVEATAELRMPARRRGVVALSMFLALVGTAALTGPPEPSASSSASREETQQERERIAAPMPERLADLLSGVPAEDLSNSEDLGVEISRDDNLSVSTCSACDLSQTLMDRFCEAAIVPNATRSQAVCLSRARARHTQCRQGCSK